MNNYPDTKDIKIYDNFFTYKIQTEIIELLDRPKWSLSAGSPDQRFWGMDDLEQEEYFSDFLFKILCRKLEKNFKIKRIYANGQTAGQSGTPHKDDGDWTFLYYPNSQWNTNDNGSLFFLEKIKSTGISEIIHTVSYKPNRGILFPAKIYHYADAPNIQYKGLRISLAFKMIEIDS